MWRGQRGRNVGWSWLNQHGLNARRNLMMGLGFGYGALFFPCLSSLALSLLLSCLSPFRSPPVPLWLCICVSLFSFLAPRRSWIPPWWGWPGPKDRPAPPMRPDGNPDFTVQARSPAAPSVIDRGVAKSRKLPAITQAPCQGLPAKRHGAEFAVVGFTDSSRTAPHAYCLVRPALPTRRSVTSWCPSPACISLARWPCVHSHFAVPLGGAAWVKDGTRAAWPRGLPAFSWPTPNSRCLFGLENAC